MIVAASAAFAFSLITIIAALCSQEIKGTSMEGYITSLMLIGAIALIVIFVSQQRGLLDRLVCSLLDLRVKKIAVPMPIARRLRELARHP